MKDELLERFELASKIKAAMLEKNKVRAWTKCPFCQKRITAVLAGPRKHLHASCETKGCFWVME